MKQKKSKINNLDIENYDKDSYKDRNKSSEEIVNNDTSLLKQTID